VTWVDSADHASWRDDCLAVMPVVVRELGPRALLAERLAVALSPHVGAGKQAQGARLTVGGAGVRAAQVSVREPFLA
jgi:hypothetical protein